MWKGVVAGAAALAVMTGSAPAQGEKLDARGFGPGWTTGLILYDEENYGGQFVRTKGEVSGFGRETNMNDKASSVRVNGNWELCEHANFKGRCVTVMQDVPDLRTLGLNNNVSSVRPASTGGDENTGMITRYDNPRWQGVPIFYCGKSTANCGKPNADAYCQMMGHADADTYGAGNRTNGRGYVPVDRSYQNGGMLFSWVSCADYGGGGSGGGWSGGNGGGSGGGGGSAS